MAKSKPFESPFIERPGGFVPELAPMPDIRDMVGLTNSQLNEVLKRFNVLPTWSEQYAEAQKYLAQFSTIPPALLSEDEYQRRIRALLDLNPRKDGKPSRGLLGLSRRVQERYTTMEAIGGQPEAELIRIAELDDNTCSGCDALAGEMGTYAYHASIGLPGSQECGNNCRCQLVRVE